MVTDTRAHTDTHNREHTCPLTPNHHSQSRHLTVHTHNHNHTHTQCHTHTHPPILNHHTRDLTNTLRTHSLSIIVTVNNQTDGHTHCTWVQWHTHVFGCSVHYFLLVFTWNGVGEHLHHVPVIMHRHVLHLWFHENSICKSFVYMHTCVVHVWHTLIMFWGQSNYWKYITISHDDTMWYILIVDYRHACTPWWSEHV